MRLLAGLALHHMVRGLAIALVLIGPRAFPQANELAEKSQRAKELMAAGKFEEAIPICRDLARALPGNAGPLANLGMALHMAGHEREAVRELEAALKISPDYLPAELFLGAAYVSLAMPAKAIGPLEKVVRAEPGDTEARALLGDALLSTERFEAAATQFQKLAELDPSNPKTWSGLGRSYEGLARRNFEQLEKLALGSTYWLVLVAETRAKADQYEGAFYFYREALAKKPSLGGVHQAVAEIYRKTGHPDWAAAEEEKESKLPSPNCRDAEGNAAGPSSSGRTRVRTSPARDPQANAEAMECAYWAGRYRDVISLGMGAKSVESYYWRSRASDKLAAEAFSRLAELPPSAETHELLAKLYFEQKRCLDASKQWQEALKLSPGSPYYEKELSVALSCSGDYEGARQLLEGLVKRAPDSAELNYCLGTALLNLKKAEEAVPYLEKAVATDPSVPAAQRELGRAYLQIGRAREAIPHLKAALPVDDDGSLYYQLGRAYRSTGQEELAQETLKKFREIQNSLAAEKKSLEKEMQITPP